MEKKLQHWFSLCAGLSATNQISNLKPNEF
jgi:hypothetical protein